MRLKKVQIDPEKQAKVIAEAKRAQGQRQNTYREQALALFPHLCARCGREFEGKNLRELTVHHKDNNHMNNPADGSNWELLCVSCHDDEHQEGDKVNHFSGYAQDSGEKKSLSFNPFEGLQGLIKQDGSEGP